MTSIPLSLPDISEDDIAAVVEVLRSKRLSDGPAQAEFENLVARRTERMHAVAVNSGAAGLHLLLRALNVGPGDQVITTPFSFVSSANGILHCGATPVFVDIDPGTLNLDPTRIEAAVTEKTKAIIAVETFGNPAGMDRIAQIAGSHELPLIEDCCQALGGRHKGRPVGSFGRAGVFAFRPHQQITTGEGGMIVTDDDRLADLCRSLRGQGCGGPSAPTPGYSGTQPPVLHAERLGFDYRLSEMACALGASQMQRLDSLLSARRRVASLYMQLLMPFEELVLPNVVDEGKDTSWYTFVVRLSATFGKTERDRIISGMRRHDIEVADHFPCIHLQPFYRETFGFAKGMCPVAESVSQRTIALPFYTRMDQTHVELVTHTLRIMLEREALLRPDA